MLKQFQRVYADMAEFFSVRLKIQNIRIGSKLFKFSDKLLAKIFILASFDVPYER